MRSVFPADCLVGRSDRIVILRFYHIAGEISPYGKEEVKSRSQGKKSRQEVKSRSQGCLKAAVLGFGVLAVLTVVLDPQFFILY